LTNPVVHKKGKAKANRRSDDFSLSLTSFTRFVKGPKLLVYFLIFIIERLLLLDTDWEDFFE